MRRILTIVGVLILACIILGIIAFVVAGPAIGNVFNSTKALVDTSTAFMTAIKAEKYDTAYDMISADQQANFGGSPDGLKQTFESNNWNKPVSWNFTSFNMNNNEGLVGGDITLSNNDKKTIQLVLHKAGEIWKIAGISIK